MVPKISIRVWGDFACFTRPEMKVERVSYPVPTPSAARGILEAIFWEPEMFYVIDHLLVIKKGKWFSFRRNEVQKVINVKAAQNWMLGKEPVVPIKAGGGADDAAQRNMLALAGVEYVITAEIHLTPKANPPADNPIKYLELVKKRAAKGKCAHRPGLGCRELAADFDWVENPTEIAIKETYSDELGIMLYDVFDPALRKTERNVRPSPVYFRASVKNNRLECHPDRVELIRPATANR